jgi:hypothetical protein
MQVQQAPRRFARARPAVLSLRHPAGKAKDRYALGIEGLLHRRGDLPPESRAPQQPPHVPHHRVRGDLRSRSPGAIDDLVAWLQRLTDGSQP